VKINKIALTKEDLFALPPNERVFLVYAGHALNELNILCRLIVIAMPVRRGEAERQFMVIQSMMFLRMLAGKLHEAWVLFGKVFYGSRLSLQFKDQLSEDGTKALRELNEYFKKPISSVTEVRNLHAFHYDAKQVDNGLENMLPHMSLDIYFDENSANTIYGFADNIINSSVMASVGSPDSHKGMETLMADTESVARSFQLLLEEVMAKIIRLRLSGKFICENVIFEDAQSTEWFGLELPTFLKSPTSWRVKLANGVDLTWEGQKIESPDFLRSLITKAPNRNPT